MAIERDAIDRAIASRSKIKKFERVLIAKPDPLLRNAL
jgi:hypothetical protein